MQLDEQVGDEPCIVGRAGRELVGGAERAQIFQQEHEVPAVLIVGAPVAAGDRDRQRRGQLLVEAHLALVEPEQADHAADVGILRRELGDDGARSRRSARLVREGDAGELAQEAGPAADRLDLGFFVPQPFDAVFSNAAIHWMRDPAAVARSTYGALKSGGRFVAEFGGKGNLKATKAALHSAAHDAGYEVSDEVAFRYYPSIGQYATLLESQGFRVTFASHFDRPTPLAGGEQGLRNWLETFADNVLELLPADKRESVIAETERRLRAEAYREGTWYADYRRIRVVAVKE